jgi:hypothetical protein
VGDVVRAVEVAIDRAVELDQRLGQLRVDPGTPRWEVATFARAGSLYDCIWNSLSRTLLANTVNPPSSQVVLSRLNTLIARPTSVGQASQAQQAQAQIAAKWWQTKDKYIFWLEVRMLHRYMTAALLARRYGFEGFDLTRASERLPIIASMMGGEKMATYLREIRDPTDPEPDPGKRRRLTGLPRLDDFFHVSR